MHESFTDCRRAEKFRHVGRGEEGTDSARGRAHGRRFRRIQPAQSTRALRSGAHEDQSGENLYQHRRPTFSKLNNALLTIVEDSFKEGTHDLQKGMCSKKRFELIEKGLAQRKFAGGVDLNPQRPEDIPDHGCWENLIDALKGYSVADEDIPSPLNLWQTMK